MPSNGTITGCGYLYNWYAATNGTNPDSGDATDSICPTSNTKFKLPTGSTSGDFAILNGEMFDGEGASGAQDIAHAANWLRDAAWQGLYSGFWTPDGLANQGISGYFWSSTASNPYYDYYLYYNATSVYPAYDNNKFYGFAVRCVFDPNP
jgi:uncharacterized protein (TIGR02145 family)